MTPYQRIREARKKSSSRQRRGVALILVLGALVVLTVFATELQERTSSTLSAAHADRDALKAEYSARSGINLSRMLIATEPIIRTAIEPMFKIALKTSAPQIPVWKFTNLVLGPFNDTTSSQDFERVTGSPAATGKNLGLVGGRFELKIVDEDAKINVNGAASGEPVARQRLGNQLLGLFGGARYNELFEDLDLDGQHSLQPAICGAMVDWADYDEVGFPCDPLGQASGSESPEDNYYPSVGLNYVRKNAPFDSLEELRLIRGVGDDFWSNYVDPESSDPEQRVLTVWGQGEKINVNSANPQTLLALVCSGAPEAPVCNDVEQIMNFLTALTLARELTQGAPLFKSPKAFVRAMRGKGKGIGPLFEAMGVQPIEFQNPKQVERAVTTESRVFSIYAYGVVPGRQRETRIKIHEVVDFRSANDLVPDSEGEGGGSAAAPPASPTGDVTPEELAAAMASDPMGVIIYHRIE
jgi:general secretion pathway protein K